MFDEQHFTRDYASVTFKETDGVTTDSDGDVSIDWGDVEQVTIENAPHAHAFDTRDFYRLRATVARPIPQPYQFGDDSGTVWLQKPRDELKKAAWSLDNRPWTMGHPDTGRVSRVDDVRGFWQDTEYYETTDDLDSYLHVPVDDEEAKQFIESNNDVSVGFMNRVTQTDAYDGDVGAEPDDKELDGYQTDMLFDHCASVKRGRCSAEHGCGLDASQHGHMTTSDTVTVITEHNEDTSTDVTADEQTSVLSEKSDSKFTHEGSWYAVPPEDNPDDEWKFPVDNCADVDDAWHFAIRERGDISIEFSTLKNRIQDRARDLGCDVPSEESEDELDVAVDSLDYEINPTMTEDGCECNDGLQVSFDDLTADAALDKIAAEHDDIDQYLSDLRGKASVAEDAAEELDVAVEQVADKAAMLDEQNDDLRETVDELQRPKMKEHAEYIADHTERFGEDVDAVLDSHESLDELQETRELVEELTSDTTTQTANADGGDDNDGMTVDRHGYVLTPKDVRSD